MTQAQNLIVKEYLLHITPFVQFMKIMLKMFYLFCFPSLFQQPWCVFNLGSVNKSVFFLAFFSDPHDHSLFLLCCFLSRVCSFFKLTSLTVRLCEIRILTGVRTVEVQCYERISQELEIHGRKNLYSSTSYKNLYLGITVCKRL